MKDPLVLRGRILHDRWATAARSRNGSPGSAHLGPRRAFTGTPISLDDRNTQEVFGEYIDIYDLTRAVEDGATVPVYFEPRLIKVGLVKGVTEAVNPSRRRSSVCWPR